ncbi:Rpn family recombination-promoting nuclease/putative transposase [Acetobacterium fimetarium]|uniref:Rpn family recombination-promoting nuclease/putative transposase n=1 Tax=Acetobacterium fimetarium TaxID=52691 RepID=A0ABR6WWZ4_9FIRM|nr:Rpn family recombination-promoting nuclease/putative transposase [Acetobacterium fimetarium]MBC3805043.1 Rpn family recombination-promoting nuclease/putative transposase [Acetobacterium fimetarium]
MKVTETKVQNPHDKFFKDTFSNPVLVRDFVENYLPEPILKLVDLNELEIQNGSHVDEELSEVFSDMLFRTKINQRDGYLYFLFEHKSYPDRMVALQLLTYMVRIWNQKVNKENQTHIPVIIPMVISHGKTKWKSGSMFSDLILNFESFPEEVKQLIPDYRYQLYDLSQFSDEDIKGKAELMIALSVARDIFKKSGEEFLETIFKAARALAELDEKETGIQYFETCMRYILTSGPKLSREQLNTVIKELEVTYKKGSEVTMTLAEILREEGFEKGIEKGEIKTLIKMAIKLLTQKFGVMPAEYSEAITKLDSTNLEILIDGIKGFENLDDVKKYLDL